MNSRLRRLQEYPFPRLRRLLADHAPSPHLTEIDLTIGEPRHAPPKLALDALRSHEGLLTKYPHATGDPAYRQAVADWNQRRYGVTLDPDTQILPVSGSREGLFALTQVLIDPLDPGVAVLPNPFYVIYEGAAILSGAKPFYAPGEGAPDLDAIPKPIRPQVKLIFITSPGNPSGHVMTLEEWETVFEFADRYGAVVVADEPYSEIYHGATPPLGAFEAAQTLGRSFERLIVFNSLSKRSSLPGLRLGFVAGDPEIIAPYRDYRTYHGAAPSLYTQAAGVAAWNDEAHVVENRNRYRTKVQEASTWLKGAPMPDAGFFLWLPCEDGERLTVDLWTEAGVKVLPGAYLGREGVGKDRIRVALVEDEPVCAEAMRRLANFLV